MCNSKPLAFQKRYDLSGYVYVAGSLFGQIIKIGFSSNYEMRETLLNNQKYGGCNDWKILIVIHGGNGGKLELQLQSKLSRYSTSREYFHDNHYTEGSELFQCSIEKVVETIEKLESDFKWVVRKDFTDYKFRNLIK